MIVMTKNEFLAQLRDRLGGLPQEDIEEKLGFYSEMIDDKIEDGMSEDAAVAELGSTGEIASQIIGETPLSKIVREKIRPRGKMKTWQIVLIAVGSPVWASLLIALLAVIFSVYVSLWAIIVSLWAVFVSFIGGALMGIVSAIANFVTGDTLMGVMMIGFTLTLAGLAIILFFCCRIATRAVVFLTKKLTLFIKRCFVRKEEA